MGRLLPHDLRRRTAARRLRVNVADTGRRLPGRPPAVTLPRGPASAVTASRCQLRWATTIHVCQLASESAKMRANNAVVGPMSPMKCGGRPIDVCPARAYAAWAGRGLTVTKAGNE